MPARWRPAWAWPISRTWSTLDQADAGAVRASRFEAVNQGWVELTRPWHLLTTNSGSGDPRAATAAKGEAVTRASASGSAASSSSWPAARSTRHFLFEPSIEIEDDVNDDQHGADVNR